jgi:hypothetical protein
MANISAKTTRLAKSGSFIEMKSTKFRESFAHFLPFAKTEQDALVSTLATLQPSICFPVVVLLSG